jgi:muramoyltetrapeptide carboxypeptidase LdcA involved in peptidoglycan recycling
MRIFAKALKPGDKIALLSPSSGAAGMFKIRFQKAVRFFHDSGYQPVVFPSSKGAHPFYSVSAEERLDDIHAAFQDEEIKAIVCNIGGLSCNDLIARLDYSLIKSHPKILVGYSDITILQLAIFAKTGLVSFYGPMSMTQFAEFPQPQQYTLDHFFPLLTNARDMPMQICAPAAWTDEVLFWEQEDIRPRTMQEYSGFSWLRQGVARGILLGGCLPSLLQLFGTPFEPDFQDKILFLENPEGEDMRKGMALSYVRSALADLDNTGVFGRISGLVIGNPYGYSQDEGEIYIGLIKEITKAYNFPVLTGFPVGHADPIATLPIGVEVSMDSEKNLFMLHEAGVDA